MRPARPVAAPTAAVRAVAALALLALLALLPPLALATVQDPSSYPAGVTKVGNTPILDGRDFQVDVTLDGADADAVAVTVCRFGTVDAPSPEICFMNVAAARQAGAWSASTGAAQHPAWRDGWVIGYKVTASTPSGDLHAPDRTTSSGDQDYYRVVVGSPQEDPQGSAVVEDAAPDAHPADTASHDAPAPVGLAVAAGLLALAARRRA